MSETLRPAAELAAASVWPFPNDSADYRRAREALLAEEIELRRHVERVAALRRALPPGGLVTGEYRFESAQGPATLAELFGEKQTLVTYSYMFGPERDRPCPMCTAFIGAFDGNAADLRQRAAYAVIARSPVPKLQAFAAERGWRNTPLFCDTTGQFSEDYHARATQDGETFDIPALNVFTKQGDEIRHFYGGEMGGESADPGQDPRGAVDIVPLWNILDMTPEGRGTDWYPKLEY